MHTGLPSVRPCRTPAVTSARSFSIFMRPPRPCPSCLRARSVSMSSGRSSIPAGSPSTMAVSPGPWDSPAVTNRKDMTPTPYKRGCGRQVGGGTSWGGLLLERDPGRATAGIHVRSAGVEGVDRPVDAADAARRDQSVALAAPCRVDASAAVAVQVEFGLVELDDVAVVVVVLVVLAVEEGVAVHVGVGQVEIRERTLVVVAGPLGRERHAVGL